jgi:hypothetical protein
MYRYCNILTFQGGTALLRYFLQFSSSDLARNIRVLHVGVDFSDGETPLVEREELWALIRAVLPEMTQLCHLVICFNGQDKNCLHRWVTDMAIPQ